MQEVFVPPPQCLQLKFGGSSYVTHLNVGGAVLRFTANGKAFAFEMHNYFGPIPVTPKTEVVLDRDWPESAWAAYERWERGGKLVDGNQCVIPESCRKCRGTGHQPTGRTYRRTPVVEDCSRCGGKKLRPIRPATQYSVSYSRSSPLPISNDRPCA